MMSNALPRKCLSKISAGSPQDAFAHSDRANFHSPFLLHRIVALPIKLPNKEQINLKFKISLFDHALLLTCNRAGMRM